jgi:hypothetical protein
VKFVAESAISITRRIASVEGRSARMALWAEFARRRPSPEVARALDTVIRRTAAGDPVATAAYLPLLDLPGFLALVGASKLASVLLAARATEGDGCLLLLEHPGSRKVAEEPGPPPDPLIERLTLGHRKAAARGMRGPTLDRILRDPDPRVVLEVLRNTHVRHSEVLAMASRRPSPEALFWALARSETWIRTRPIRRAIALNPYAPPRLAAAVVVTLAQPDWREMAAEPGLHRAVRDAAELAIGWRRSAGG